MRNNELGLKIMVTDKTRHHLFLLIYYFWVCKEKKKPYESILKFGFFGKTFFFRIPPLPCLLAHTRPIIACNLKDRVRQSQSSDVQACVGRTSGEVPPQDPFPDISSWRYQNFHAMYNETALQISLVLLMLILTMRWIFWCNWSLKKAGRKERWKCSTLSYF